MDNSNNTVYVANTGIVIGIWFAIYAIILGIAVSIVGVEIVIGMLLRQKR